MARAAGPSTPRRCTARCKPTILRRKLQYTATNDLARSCGWSNPPRMIRFRLQALLAALALLLLPSPAAAWWEYGHETIAEVAMKLLKPRTRQSILALLKQQKVLETPTCPARTIEEASVWPDCIKTLGDRFSYQYAW